MDSPPHRTRATVYQFDEQAPKSYFPFELVFTVKSLTLSKLLWEAELDISVLIFWSFGSMYPMQSTKRNLIEAKEVPSFVKWNFVKI